MGLDFGTLSGRAIAVDVTDGRELSSAEMAYPHGVMDRALPNGQALPPDFALQHPLDYLRVLEDIVPRAVKAAGVNKEDIIGIGLDCTSSTVFPVNREGVPLCFLPEFEGEPHAYAKLWKHHAAAPYARKMEEIALKRGESWLPYYGGKVSSEWLFPKLWETLDKAPLVYAGMAHYMEAGDWLVYRLSRVFSQNACMAGYKAFYNPKTGFPSSSYFAACDERLHTVVRDKLSAPVFGQGRRVGGLTAEYADKLGLIPGIAVAAANVDAHVCLPSVKINAPKRMLVILGTSACHLMLSNLDVAVAGICGSVPEGILPGFVGLEAGQSGVGDLFDWFVNNAVPEQYHLEAKKRGQNVHAYLQELAGSRRAGDHGLLALDWWGGNRSILVDPEVTGLLIGMTLQTKPEDIYRALVEAAAFGTRKIIDNYIAHGVSVEQVYLAGGITDKSPFVVKVFADVLGMPMHLSGTAQGSALGSAMFAAVAAGEETGGYDGILTAAEKMGKLKEKPVLPDADNHRVYTRLHELYCRLHERYGRQDDLMKQLKRIRMGM